MHLPSFFQACLILSFLACQQGAKNAPTLTAHAVINPAADQETRTTAAAGIVFQSADNGESWQDISAGLPEDLLVMRILPGKTGEVYLGAEHGLFRYSPPPATDTWTNEFPMNDMVVGIFSGPTGMYVRWVENGFFKNLPGKADWMPMNDPSAKKYVWSAVETPEGAVVVCNENGIFKTNDDGESWKQVFREESPYSLHIDNGLLYGVCFGGILRSTDGGDHWDWEMKDDGSYKSIYRLDGALIALVRKEDTWTTRFLSASTLHKNWQHLAAGLSGMRNINDFEQAGDTLYCSHEGGVSRSDNRGKTWQLLLPAPKDNLILRLTLSGGKVFVVKSTGC
jgi:photosystem II stability/assembly factor-like uncharacterized protein